MFRVDWLILPSMIDLFYELDESMETMRHSPDVDDVLVIDAIKPATGS